MSTSWLRWSYSGPIIQGTTVDDILVRSSQAEFDICFIQASGHILPDQWNPLHDVSNEFFNALSSFTEKHDFLVACDTTHGSGDSQGMLSRWLVVNLRHYHKAGCPRFAGDIEGAEFVRASRALGLPVVDLDAKMHGLMLDLGPDLAQNPAFLRGLASRSAQSHKSLFPWNYESYDDVIEPPPHWRGPISTLFSVAAGLKPHMILRTHEFDDKTEVVFFDYSDYALRFQKLLIEEWDGRDYPAFLKYAASQLPLDAYYYFLPGASLDDPEAPEMQTLWQREIERWGGEESLRRHWARVRRLQYRYVGCNLLTEPENLLDQLTTDRPGAVIWWSNSFHTAYTACNYTVEEKQFLYENWMRVLAQRAPQLFLYGSDHSNSCVNGMTAAEYLAAYDEAGGDPLAERRLYRRAVRF